VRGEWLGVRVDAVEEWSRAQQRVIDLVADLPAERAALRVPACPDWTVRDLLSHMVGLGADVVAGDEPDDHNAEWTSRQVQVRRDRDVPALVAEWQAVAEPLRAWMRANTVRPLNDVLIHEQDLRGALEVPGGQDAEGWAAIRERFTGRLAGRVGDLPPIALVGDDGWAWVSRDAVDDAAVVLQAPTFDLTRALVTRRSAAQLKGWTVRGDVGPYLDAFAMLGPLPTTDLTESGPAGAGG
jgi:uncharacterized protein (TIGR03083 family)